MSASSQISGDARRILQEHVKKAYQQNAYPQAWRNLPEVPSAEEIKPHSVSASIERDDGPDPWNDYQTDPPYDSNLPHNQIRGPWSSKEEYIGAHYQILREDAIASLRNSVAEVALQPSMVDSSQTCIYTDVTFIGLQLSRMGVASRVEFSAERAGKRIRWEQSKRLVQGTVVALTPTQDMFKTVCKIATIAARPILGGLGQNPPTIDLFWGDIGDIALDPVEKYVMVESRQGYFEASRHMLVAMQKLMTERFLFEKYLVHLDTNVATPKYLNEQPFLNLTSIEKPASRSNEGSSLFNVDALNSFPGDISCGMDMSQLQACENMLTKSLSIVQGPPGTGKTFVSISALKVFVQNLGARDPPIIVAAQTNHALDQLLNHILSFENNIVRLGGRSDKSNKEILKRTLYELRQNNSGVPQANAGMRSASNEHRLLCDEIRGVLSPLLNDMILTAETLLKYGIITEGQSKSLHDDEWAEEEEDVKGDIATWLTEGQCMPIVGARLEDFGLPLEEGDIEFEQLQELEQQMAEAGGPDDKDHEFGLNGEWVPFGRRHTGRHEGLVDDTGVKKLLGSLRSENLYHIPLARRGEVYRYFEKQMNDIMMLQLHQVLQKYKKYVEDYSITKSMCAISLMKHLGIKVIGCTTTGLSRYRSLLSALQPRTLLIEEAAETMEGGIIGGMIESLEQLVLVGDHLQLQGSCTIRALEDEPYYLKISMFERLVKNNMPYVMLNKQRRMIPDVRKLLCIEPKPFYPNLHDHASVLDRIHNRPPVAGMGGLDTYFFHHIWGESRNTDGSCYNLIEAEMIAGFFNYLYLNGVETSKITVLTFYNGQRKTLLKELKKYPSLKGAGYLNVFTVDSYQGEENDIILLSLVRSNRNLSIGFLENKNRLVVALSRARRGLYLFGNVITLTGAESKEETNHGREPLWDPLLHYMIKQGRLHIENGLPIKCIKHGNWTKVFEPSQWLLNAGGCNLNCSEGPLPCGHDCELQCHPFDHARVICKQPCKVILPCGHGCSRECGETCICENCYSTETALVDIFLPDLQDSRVAQYPGSSPASSWSPSKGALNNAGSRGSGRRRVTFNDTPPHNPYTVADVRRELPYLTSNQVSSRGPRLPSASKSRVSRSGRSFSDQSTKHHSRAPTKSHGAFNQFSGDLSSNYFSRPVQSPGQQARTPVKTKSPGNNPWSTWDPKKSDRELLEINLEHTARIPKTDPPKFVIHETFRPVTVQDGVRKADRSGPVHSIIPHTPYASVFESSIGPLASRTLADPNIVASGENLVRSIQENMTELQLGRQEINNSKIVQQKRVTSLQDSRPSINGGASRSLDGVKDLVSLELRVPKQRGETASAGLQTVADELGSPRLKASLAASRSHDLTEMSLFELPSPALNSLPNYLINSEKNQAISSGKTSTLIEATQDQKSTVDDTEPDLVDLYGASPPRCLTARLTTLSVSEGNDYVQPGPLMDQGFSTHRSVLSSSMDRRVEPDLIDLTENSPANNSTTMFTTQKSGSVEHEDLINFD